MVLDFAIVQADLASAQQRADAAEGRADAAEERADAAEERANSLELLLQQAQADASHVEKAHQAQCQVRQDILIQIN